MITHYGLFWSERNVFWGRQKNPGKLLGREERPLGRLGAPTTAERKSFKDYRNYVGLYCLYNGRQLIYVGEGGLGTKETLFSRLKGHRTGHLTGVWDYFSWFGRETTEGECEVKEALAQLEAIAIAAFNPGFNRQSGTFGRAVRVFQAPHKDAEGDIETKFDNLSTLIAEIPNVKDIVEERRRTANRKRTPTTP